MRGLRARSPTTIAIAQPAIELVAGGQTLCALYADGGRDCVGNGSLGQLGTSVAETPTTFKYIDQPAATAMAVDGSNACFVEGNAVRCVGSNRLGVLGTPEGATPMPVPLACR